MYRQLSLGTAVPIKPPTLTLGIPASIGHPTREEQNSLRQTASYTQWDENNDEDERKAEKSE